MDLFETMFIALYIMFNIIFLMSWIYIKTNDNRIDEPKEFGRYKDETINKNKDETINKNKDKK